MILDHGTTVQDDLPALDIRDRIVRLPRTTTPAISRDVEWLEP